MCPAPGRDRTSATISSPWRRAPRSILALPSTTHLAPVEHSDAAADDTAHPSDLCHNAPFGADTCAHPLSVLWQYLIRIRRNAERSSSSDAERPWHNLLQSYIVHRAGGVSTQHPDFSNTFPTPPIGAGEPHVPPDILCYPAIDDCSSTASGKPYAAANTCTDEAKGSASDWSARALASCHRGHRHRNQRQPAHRLYQSNRSHRRRATINK